MTTDFETRFLAARRAVIARRFSHLNDMQQKAVMTTEGPLLLLAGAGSGKTTVLIQRIANLIAFGEGANSNEIPDYITEDDVEFLKQHPCEESNDVRQVTSVVKTYTFTVEAVALVDYRSIAWTIAQSMRRFSPPLFRFPE